MLTFIGAGLLIGALIGRRLTILGLVPGLGLVLCVAALAWRGHAGPGDWAQLIALVVFLQIGYMCGAALRLFVAPILGVQRRKALRSP